MKSIEEEVQQKKWHNDQHKAVINILFTYHVFKENMSSLLKPYKISFQQYNVLRILRASHPKGISSVFIQNRKSDVSRLINRIEKLGLIERRQNREDKRISEIYLTLRGLELLGQIRVIDKFYKDKMPQKLSDEDAQLLSALLDKSRM
jgi:DNA-binding MarR family transcriptional regulator